MSAAASGSAAWLVDLHELARTLRDRPDDVTVLDARGAWAYWIAGHVPGAQHVRWWAYRDGWGRTGRLPRDLRDVARRLAADGVDADREVVVYGAARRGWGEEGRIAWMLAYLGHPRVRVLDGGWDAWRAAGGARTRRLSRPRAGRFEAAPQPSLRASTDDVRRALAHGDVVLDVRSAAEWHGAARFGVRGGHVPGAVHLDWRELLDPAGRVDDSAAARERLLALGLRPDGDVITYCTAGVRSAEAVVALRALGFRGARNYDGSWWEWSRAAPSP